MKIIECCLDIYRMKLSFKGRKFFIDLNNYYCINNKVMD